MNKDICFRSVVSLFLVGSYFLLPKYGFTAFGWWEEDCNNVAVYGTHLLYPISHANVWHLAANVLCLWMLRCPLHLVATYGIAVMCSFLPSFSLMDWIIQGGDTPCTEATMGFSGVLFAMVGISWGKIRRFKDMIWRNKWILIIPAFIPHINFLIHVYCLLGGYVYGFLISEYRDNGISGQRNNDNHAPGNKRTH